YVDRSLGATEALEAGQVDFRAVGVADLLRQANGTRVVTAAGERALRLESSAVDVRFHKPGPWRRFLHALANTSLVYVLLVAGALLVAFEIFQPGFGVAGVTGALLLVAAVYGLNVIPVALWAVAIFVAGCVLLAADVALDGLGAPTIAGVAGFGAGSFLMFPGPAQELRIAWWLALVGTLSATVFFVPVMTMVRRARQPIRRVADATLVGRAGQVRSMLNPEGYVWVADALWRARADENDRIRVGEDVLVTGVDGVVLRVRRT
ncbi:MAG: NfeD family protein, partial [Actinomycetota bacterium]